jgi:ribonuclease HII
MIYPTFNEESFFWKQGLKHIAGVDEVGRGCFAGPVVTAAVILPPTFASSKPINDSKKLSSKVRTELAEIIKQQAIAYAIAEVSVEVINQIGIGKATQIAFVQAVKQLSQIPDHILIDAFYILDLPRANQKPIIRGDGISISIAAASIIAKVYRDKLMEKLHIQYEQYDFATNKGYGTKKHRDAIGKYGLCDLHRTSFNLQKFVTPSI